MLRYSTKKERILSTAILMGIGLAFGIASIVFVRVTGTENVGFIRIVLSSLFGAIFAIAGILLTKNAPSTIGKLTGIVLTIFGVVEIIASILVNLR